MKRTRRFGGLTLPVTAAAAVVVALTGFLAPDMSAAERSNAQAKPVYLVNRTLKGDRLAVQGRDQTQDSEPADQVIMKTRKGPAVRSGIPEACDPAVSRLVLADEDNIVGHCLVQAETNVRVASLQQVRAYQS